MERPVHARLLLAAAAASGALVLIAHGANLRYLARQLGCESALLLCPTEVGPWATGDLKTYHRVAHEIDERGLLGASYLRRSPGYPLVLLLSERLTGHVSPVRLLGPPLAALGAGAVAWLAGTLSGRIGPALLAGPLLCLWFGAYRYTAGMGPDGMHAFLAVAALAFSVGWRRSERALLGGAAGVLWVVVQSLRPTFFALPAILPALLFRRRASARYVRTSLLLWLATFAVPALLVTSNRVHHGIAVPSQILANNLACYSVSRLEHERGRGDFDALRWGCIEHFQRMEPRERIPGQMAYARRVLLAKPSQALLSFTSEILSQLIHPLEIWDVAKRKELYPDWATAGPGWLVLFWGCAAGGTLILARRDPGLATFLGLAWLLVMLPASTSHFAGDRLRFPLDLLFMPVALAFLASLAAPLRWLPEPFKVLRPRPRSAAPRAGGRRARGAGPPGAPGPSAPGRASRSRSGRPA